MTTTTVYMTAALCLTIGVFGLGSGLLKAKWAVMAGLSGMVLNVIALAMDAATTVLPKEPASTWRDLQHVVVMLVTTTILVIAGRKVLRAIGRRHLAKVEWTSERWPEADPARIALAWAPEMVADVNMAMDRIALLKSISDKASDQKDIDVVIMMERHMPSILDRYGRTSEASTPEEHPAIARMALGSIVEIGRMADDARRRIAADLRDGLDTESRYVTTRAESVGDLHAD